MDETDGIDEVISARKVDSTLEIDGRRESVTEGFKDGVVEIKGLLLTDRSNNGISNRSDDGADVEHGLHSCTS